MNPSNSSPYRHTSTVIVRANTASPNPAITPTTEDSTKSTQYYLARRLQVVFNDLGLLPHIPSDWLQPGPDGLAFRSLGVPEADKFVLAVEDLANGRPARRPTVSPDQLSFDLGDV